MAKKNLGRILTACALAAIVLLVGLMGIYRVNEGEEAILLTFREMTDKKDPGLYWRIPFVQTVPLGPYQIFRSGRLAAAKHLVKSMAVQLQGLVGIAGVLMDLHIRRGHLQLLIQRIRVKTHLPQALLQLLILFGGDGRGQLCRDFSKIF